MLFIVVYSHLIDSLMFLSGAMATDLREVAMSSSPLVVLISWSLMSALMYYHHLIPLVVFQQQATSGDQAMSSWPPLSPQQIQGK